MYARKIAASLFSLALGLTFAAVAGASDAAAPSKDAKEKSCCRHEASGGDTEGAHCARAAKHGKGPAGKNAEDCCAQHAGAATDGEQADCCCCDDACERPSAITKPTKT